METVKPLVPSIPCAVHSSHTIQKIDLRSDAEKHLYCMECILESNDPKTLSQNLATFTDFLRNASTYYLTNSHKLTVSNDMPAEYAEVLSKQKTNLSEMKDHIEWQKQIVYKVFEEIKNVVIEQINQTQNRYIQVLDDQILGVNDQCNSFEKELRISFPTAEDLQILFPSKVELEERLSKLADSKELEVFVKNIIEDLNRTDLETLNSKDIDSKRQHLDGFMKELQNNLKKKPVIETKSIDFSKYAKDFSDSLEKYLADKLTLENAVSKNFQIGTLEKRLLMLGLDASGKTSLLYKLKLDEVVSTVPTIGFNVETIEYKNFKYSLWDVGGQEKMRPIWRHYYQNTDGLIFVVDSTDKERVDKAREELENVLANEEFKNTPLLIFANKQDIEGMSVTEVCEKLELNKLKGRSWYVQGACCVTGDGLKEGLEWLSRTLAQKK